MATKNKPRLATEVVVDVKPKVDSFYTAEGSIEEFCAYICKGGHMARFCEERGLPYKTVSDWVYNNPARAAMYAHAREERAEVLADEIVAISDETCVETKYEGEEVKLVLDATAVARNRLRVDARKWVASKLKPRKYGDKNTTELTGAGGGPVQIAALSLNNLSSTELAQMETLLKKSISEQV
jgi:hypothetical protein